MFASDKNKIQNLNFRIHLRNIEKVYSEFEKNNVSPVLIKGLAAAINYPTPYQRIFSDIDLAVDPDLFDKAERIVLKNKFNVDLHRGLRHLDTMNWESLYKNSQIQKIENIAVRVLRPEDHLRVLCIHWLTDGGADRTRLWDIYFAVRNRPAEFDWNGFFGSVDDKRKEWLSIALLAANFYLGLDLGNGKSSMTLSNLPGRIKNELEKEWASDIRLSPLENNLSDYKKLFPQLRKRFPTNLLQAIVLTESYVDDDKFYLIRANDFIKRAKKLLRKVL